MTPRTRTHPRFHLPQPAIPRHDLRQQRRLHVPELPLCPSPQLWGAEDEPPVVDRVQPAKHPVETQNRSRTRMPGVHTAAPRSTAGSQHGQSASLVARRVIPKVPAFRESPQRIAVPVESRTLSVVESTRVTPAPCRTIAGGARNTIIGHAHDMPEAANQCGVNHVEIDAAFSDALQSFYCVSESAASPLQQHREHRPDVRNRDRHVDLAGREAT